jgi:hypothetical protein
VGLQVVVFDTNIPFQLAFYALIEHGTTMDLKRTQKIPEDEKSYASTISTCAVSRHPSGTALGLRGPQVRGHHGCHGLHRHCKHSEVGEKGKMTDAL